MEVQMTLTLDELGHITADEADRLLDELLARLPDNGPVLGQDLAEGTLSIVFAFTAEPSETNDLLPGVDSLRPLMEQVRQAIEAAGLEHRWAARAELAVA
jgi:hypothetical protein